MPNYRRNYVPGGSYFFTVNLNDRRQDLLTRHWPLLRRAIQAVQGCHPFRLDALVVLPDHLHTVWTLPEGDADFSSRWRAVKSRFSKALAGDRPIWQPRFWEHTLKDEGSYRRHLDYVHRNPVKHGWVRRVRDWPYSTFHRYVEKGVYSLDWMGGAGQG
ncbi:REP-associated tyrosine transposase [Alcanivorax hongdengensis]